VSYAIYPEGTRSRDGKLGKFKTGAFRLAIDAGLPIVVLTIANTGKALLPKTYFGLDSSITSKLIISEEVIETTNLTHDDIDKIIKKVRRTMIKNLEKYQN